MKIIIVDDKAEVIDNLTSIIRKKYNAEIISANSISEIIAKSSEMLNADIAFLDIQLKDESGISLGCYLQQKNPELKIVFISGFPDMVTDIFLSMPAMGFVDKPLRKEKIYAYIDKAIESAENDLFSYYINGRKRNFHKNSIVYIESKNKFLLIHTHSEIFKAIGKLDDIENQLGKHFVRCHKSFVINMRYISCRKLLKFILINKEEINISRTYRDEAIDKYNKYKGGIIT